MTYPSFKDMTLNPITLRFKATLLENNFKKYSYSKVLLQLRIALFLIIFLFFAISYFYPDFKENTYQLLSLSFIGFLIFFLSFLKFFYNIKNISLSFLILLYSGATILLLQNITSYNLILFYSGVLFIFSIFNYVFLGINFVYSIINGILVMILYLAFVPYTMYHITQIFPLILLIINFVGILTNYSMEFIARREFYLSTMQNENQKILDDVTDILEARVKKSTEKLRKKNEELMREIEERKKIEEKMNQSLKEKDILLKEIHHRVKNNMQIISSMLLLQSRYSDDEKLKTILLESQNRIETMALVHEKLYQSENLADINFKSYVDSLLKNILTLFNRRSSVIYNINCNDDTLLNINTAIPLGLLLSELITNSVKHGFKNLEKGKIDISLEKLEDKKFRLKYKNDGNKFPDNIDIKNMKIKSYGLKLITILTSQLDGTIKLNRDNGTEFVIDFYMI